MDLNEFKEEISATIKERYARLAKEEENVVIDLLLRYDNQKETVAKIPNDKIILSADLFSRIVNLVSFAESHDMVEEGLLTEIVADVKKNRASFERVEKPIEKKIEKEEDFNDEIRNLDDFEKRLGMLYQLLR